MVASLVVFPATVGSFFEAIYADLGGMDLPALTRWVIGRWAAPAMALPSIGLLGYAALPKATLLSRRIAAVAAFVLAFSALAVCMVAIYLPIFSLADSIQAD